MKFTLSRKRWECEQEKAEIGGGLSVQAMSRVLDLELPSSEKFVLLSVANHADPYGRCSYPSVDTICKETCLAESTVRGLLTCLRTKSLLLTEKSATQHRPTTYALNIGLPSTRPLQSRPPESRPLDTSTKTNPDLQNTAFLYPRPPDSGPEPKEREPKEREPKKTAAMPPGTPPVIFSCLAFSVNRSQDEKLGDAYPWVDRQQEYRKADLWTTANRPGRKVKNVLAFLQNWFNKVRCEIEGGGNGKQTAKLTGSELLEHNLRAAGFKN